MYDKNKVKMDDLTSIPYSRSVSIGTKFKKEFTKDDTLYPVS